MPLFKTSDRVEIRFKFCGWWTCSALRSGLWIQIYSGTWYYVTIKQTNSWYFLFSFTGPPHIALGFIFSKKVFILLLPDLLLIYCSHDRGLEFCMHSYWIFLFYLILKAVLSLHWERRFHNSSPGFKQSICPKTLQPVSCYPSRLCHLFHQRLDLLLIVFLNLLIWNHPERFQDKVDDSSAFELRTIFKVANVVGVI